MLALCLDPFLQDVRVIYLFIYAYRKTVHTHAANKTEEEKLYENLTKN